jgi:polyhydroxybutyrate depolymerase
MASPTSSGVQHASLTVDGLKRTYRLYVPGSLDSKQPAPLVFLLHESGSSGDQIATALRGCRHCSYDDQADAGGFIIVYPDSLSWNWKGETADTAVDVTFVSRLLDRLTADLRIDTTRIFAVGVSSGAILAYRLACELSERIAAIASVSGEMRVEACNPARPVSILEMHATEDPNVPYQGAANSVKRWATLDGCATKPTETVTGITKTSTWIACHGGTVVRLDSVAVVDHGWFTSDPALAGQVPVGEPDSTPVTWTFLKNSPPRR